MRKLGFFLQVLIAFTPILSRGAVIAGLVIANDEPISSVQFSTTRFSAVEAAREAIIVVSLTLPADRDLTFHYETVGGSAMAGADFVHTNGTITFRRGQTTTSVRVALVDDGPSEAEESFSVILSNPSPGLTLGTPSVANVIIIDGHHNVTCDEAQLRAAVHAGGRINLACDGTIVLRSPLVVSRPVMLDGLSHQPTLSGNGRVRHLLISPGVNLVLRHLTLADGFVQGTNPPTVAGGPGEGGAVYNDGGVLYATHCRFVRNIARGSNGGDTTQNGGPGRGGAIHNVGGGIFIGTNCALLFNAARGGGGGTYGTGFRGGDAQGGAIFNGEGLVELQDCVLSTNATVSGTPGLRGRGGLAAGGAILNRGDLVLAGATLSGNTIAAETMGPAHGGAVHGETGVIEILRCSFVGNRAAAGRGAGFGLPSGQRGGDAFGGAIGVSNGTLRVLSSLFDKNAAIGGAEPGGGAPAGSAYGGALFNAAVTASTNSTFCRNEARSGESLPGRVGSARGGAIYNSGGYAVLSHLTIAENAVLHPSGVTTANLEASGIFSVGGPITLANSILAHNYHASNCVGNIIDGGHNLSTDSSCDFTAGGGLVNADPQLGPLADYGGATFTKPLHPSSPAIDAARNALCPSTDQRGVARPHGANCDIGAFESAPPYTIRGRMDGYRQSSEGIRIHGGGSSTALANDGTYILHTLTNDSVIVTPMGYDSIFIPSNRVVFGDILGVDFYSYRSNAYVLQQLDQNRSRAVFAGAAGSTWRTLTSSNLIEWSEYGRHTTDGNGFFEFIHTNNFPVLQRYFRGQRLP